MHVTGEHLSYKVHLPNKGCVIRDKTMYLTDEYAVNSEVHLTSGYKVFYCDFLNTYILIASICTVLLNTIIGGKIIFVNGSSVCGGVGVCGWGWWGGGGWGWWCWSVCLYNQNVSQIPSIQ